MLKTSVDEIVLNLETLTATLAISVNGNQHRAEISIEVAKSIISSGAKIDVAANKQNPNIVYYSF